MLSYLLMFFHKTDANVKIILTYKRVELACYWTMGKT